MPVIGRLDEQVGRVLIDPVRRRGDADDAQDDERPAPATPTTPADADEVAGDEGEGRPREELPVWLL